VASYPAAALIRLSMADLAIWQTPARAVGHCNKSLAAQAGAKGEEIDLIAEQKEVSMAELIEEIETICFSGTKLTLDYYINQVIELDKQDEIYEYFMSADTDDIADALENCEIEDVTEEELRLMRIKFLSELAN
jgi:hypothetical protein